MLKRLKEVKKHCTDGVNTFITRIAFHKNRKYDKWSFRKNKVAILLIYTNLKCLDKGWKE